MVLSSLVVNSALVVHPASMQTEAIWHRKRQSRQRRDGDNMR
jgi:hypothetical protein